MVRGIDCPPDRPKGTRLGEEPPALEGAGGSPPTAGRRWVQTEGCTPGLQHNGALNWAPPLARWCSCRSNSQGRALPNQPAAGWTPHCPIGSAAPRPTSAAMRVRPQPPAGPSTGPHPTGRRPAWQQLGTPARARIAGCQQHPPTGHFYPTAGCPARTSPTAQASPPTSRSSQPKHQRGPPQSRPLALHTAVGAGCKQGGQSLAGRAVGISCSAMHATSSRGWSGRMEWEGSTVGCGCVSKQGPGGPQAALGGAAATASGQCTTSLDVAG